MPKNQAQPKQEQKPRMEWGDVKFFIAQCAINIAEGITEVQPNSAAHKAMVAFCDYANEGLDPAHTPRKPCKVCKEWIGIENGHFVDHGNVVTGECSGSGKAA